MPRTWETSSFARSVFVEFGLSCELPALKLSGVLGVKKMKDLFRSAEAKSGNFCLLKGGVIFQTNAPI